MKFGKDEVKRLAELARIEVDDAPAEQLVVQMNEIVGYFEQLKELRMDDVAPTAGLGDGENVWREDEPGESLDLEKALESAPQRSGDQFAVPPVK